jgi:hypothetical protein
MVIDWSSLIPNLVATLVGVAGGFPVALGIERWIGSRRKGEEATVICSVLHDALNHNLELLRQMEGELPSLVPTYGFDVDALIAVSPRLYEFFDADVCTTVYKVKYELLHLNRKVDSLISIHLAYCSNENKGFEVFGIMQVFSQTEQTKTRDMLSSSLLGLVRTTIPLVEGAMLKLENTKHHRKAEVRPLSH